MIRNYQVQYPFVQILIENVIILYIELFIYFIKRVFIFIFVQKKQIL